MLGGGGKSPTTTVHWPPTLALQLRQSGAAAGRIRAGDRVRDHRPLPKTLPPTSCGLIRLPPTWLGFPRIAHALARSPAPPARVLGQLQPPYLPRGVGQGGVLPQVQAHQPCLQHAQVLAVGADDDDHLPGAVLRLEDAHELPHAHQDVLHALTGGAVVCLVGAPELGRPVLGVHRIHILQRPAFVGPQPPRVQEAVLGHDSAPHDAKLR
mmetsp:Transcript_18730/g.60158  ORF Transcript_18730/g.60158 Transcript_18730/m.60158 type:complete len:210 (+) Transcript_18730:107-736(+)